MNEHAEKVIAALEAGNVYVGEFGVEVIERVVREAQAQAYREAHTELNRLGNRIVNGVIEDEVAAKKI